MTRSFVIEKSCSEVMCAKDRSTTKWDKYFCYADGDDDDDDDDAVDGGGGDGSDSIGPNDSDEGIFP